MMEMMIVNAKSQAVTVTVDAHYNVSHAFDPGFNPDHVKPIESLTFKPPVLAALMQLATAFTPHFTYAHKHTDTVKWDGTDYSGFNAIQIDFAAGKNGVAKKVRLLRHSASMVFICFEDSDVFAGKEAIAITDDNYLDVSRRISLFKSELKL